MEGMKKTHRRCPECVETIDYPAEIKFCPRHGKQIELFDAPQCSKCGAEVTKDTGATYCTECGTEIGT